MVQLDDATKGLQTFTKAPSQFNVIAFISFFCVFPQILEYRPATSDCFGLHSNEELHLGNQSQNVLQGNLLDRCLTA